MDDFNEEDGTVQPTEPTFLAPRLRGTYGGLDYTIVAEKDNVHMGLKLMRDSSYDQFPRCSIAIRLRTVFMRDADDKEIRPFDSFTAAKRQLLGAFPGMKYEVCDDTRHGFRARTHVKFVTGCHLAHSGAAADAFKEDRFYSKLYSFLEPFVQAPAAFTLSYDEFAAALEEQILTEYPVSEVPDGAIEEGEIDFSNVLEAKITNLAGDDGAMPEILEGETLDAQADAVTDEGVDIDDSIGDIDTEF